MLEDLDDAEIWPENLLTVNVFIGMSTQWRAAMGGPIGLDYTALPAVMRLMNVPRAQWRETFEGLRVMEAEAMHVMSVS